MRVTTTEASLRGLEEVVGGEHIRPGTPAEAVCGVVPEVVVAPGSQEEVDAVQRALAVDRQFLALDAPLAERATLGGIVSANVAGPLRQRYGGVRDQLIGITLARADGKLAKAGGKVVKNVAGYDLMKLLTGAFGTLGIVVRCAFRLYPLPEASGTVVAEIPDAERLRQALAATAGSTLVPAGACVLAGEARAGGAEGARPLLAGRFATVEAAVREQ